MRFRTYFVTASCAVVALLALPLVVAATGRRAKNDDGNLWGLDRFRAGSLIRGECSTRPCIALTFDDGPEHTTTPRVLEELDRQGVKATFFVVGQRFAGTGAVAERNLATLRDTWRRGHMIGNHTFTHALMDGQTDAQLSSEIDRTGEAIFSAIGVHSYLFRAPYGAMHDPRAGNAVYSRGLTPVFWAIDTRDWASHSAAEVLANFRAGLDASPRGGVVLFHDTLEQTTQALPMVFAEIATRNAQRRARQLPTYEFVGLDDLWHARGRRR